MRILPLLVLAIIVGCDAKPNVPASGAAPIAKTLGPGDPAPGLSVTKWLHGEPVTMATGKVYVVDFWASWCGPCRISMPHLDGLAKEYGSKGVEVIAVTSADEQGNILPRVERFINEKCKSLQIHFAWCETADTFNAWMGAANLSGIPTTFVIDRHGKIAFIGHPADLDDVLPKVVAGTWRGREDVDAIAFANGKLLAIFDKVDRAGLTAVDRLGANAKPEAGEAAFLAAAKAAAPNAIAEYVAFRKEYPRKAEGAQALSKSMILYLRVGNFDEAKKQAEALLKLCQVTGDEDSLVAIWRNWMARSLNPQRQYAAIAVAAAEQLLIIHGETNADTVLGVAEANKAAGNEARAKVMIDLARKLTAGDPERSKKVEAAIKAFQ